MPRWAIDITAGTGGFEAAAKRISGSMKKAAEESAISWRGMAEAATVSIGGIVGAAAGLYGIASTIAGWHDEIDDLSVSTGLAADTVQALQLQAESAGGSFEDIAGVAKRLPKLLGDADRGVKTVLTAFGRLGVETHDAAGGLRSSDAVLRDVIRGLGDIRDPTEKAAVAMQLFGRQGATALEAFGSGSALFEQHEKIAKKYGISTGPEAAEAAARLQEEMARLGLVARGAGDDLWEAFGGQGGALGGIRMMTTGLIYSTDLIVELRNRLKGATAGETIWNLLSPTEAGTRLDAFSDSLDHAAARAQEYMDTATATDQIAEATSLAIAALAAEIEAAARKADVATDLQKIYADQLAQIAGLQSDLTADLLSDSERITAAWIAQTEPLVALVELYGAEGEIAEAAMDALADAEGRLQRDLLSLEEQRIAESDRLRQEEADQLATAADKRIADAQREADARLDMERRVTDGKMRLASLAADTMMAYSELMVDSEGEATRQGQALAKASAITGIISSTAAGIMGSWEAYADIPFVGVPLAIAQSALIGGIGVAQLGQVASAYTGADLSYAASTGTTIPITVHPGERTRVETRSEVERGKRPQQSYTQVWIGGRQVAATVTEDTRAGGPMAAELRRRGGRLGHAPGWR